MLSVIILTRNEETIIADAIESVKDIAGEILVIDSHSEDRTADVAQHVGATVFQHDFVDFSSQRNFAFKKTNFPWVLYLDADERATPEFKNELRKTIENYDPESQIGGYFIRRKIYYYGHNWNQSDTVQRLFIKERFIKWEGVVHETPSIKGAFSHIKSPLLHFTHRSLQQMIEKTNKWSEYEAELRFNAHHPPMNSLRFMRVIATAFFTSYIKEGGYKNGTYGIIESLYQSFSMFITYAKLWEKQQEKYTEEKNH